MSRVLLAVLAGCLVIACLAFAGTAATAAIFGVSSEAARPAKYLVSNIVIGMVAAAAGGYLAARLAPEGRVTVTVGLLLVVFFAIGIVTGRANATATEPRWYQAVVTMLGASGLASGVVIERAFDASRRRS